jgi:hypothetical protein
MAVTDFVWARTHLPSDLTGVNNHATDDIGPNLCVKVDTTAANTLPTAAAVGVALATTDDTIYGVTVETMKAVGGYGRVAQHGIVQCVASAAIAVGAWVQASTVGKVVTSAAAKPSVGIALTAAGADTDPVLVLLHIGKNA